MVELRTDADICPGSRWHRRPCSRNCSCARGTRWWCGDRDPARAAILREEKQNRDSRGERPQPLVHRARRARGQPDRQRLARRLQRNHPARGPAPARALFRHELAPHAPALQAGAVPLSQALLCQKSRRADLRRRRSRPHESARQAWRRDARFRALDSHPPLREHGKQGPHFHMVGGRGLRRSHFPPAHLSPWTFRAGPPVRRARKIPFPASHWRRARLSCGAGRSLHVALRDSASRDGRQDRR